MKRGSRESADKAEVQLALCDRIQLVLRALKMSQGEFARQLEVSTGYVSEVARGKKKPGSEFLGNLRRKLGVSIDWLIAGTGPMFYSEHGLIEPDWFESISMQIATARAAMVDQDLIARDLLCALADGQGIPGGSGSRFNKLLERIAPGEDRQLAIDLYNKHLTGANTPERRRDVLNEVIAYFRPRRGSDKIGALLGQNAEK